MSCQFQLHPRRRDVIIGRRECTWKPPQDLDHSDGQHQHDDTFRATACLTSEDSASTDKIKTGYIGTADDRRGDSATRGSIAVVRSTFDGLENRSDSPGDAAHQALNGSTSRGNELSALPPEESSTRPGNNLAQVSHIRMPYMYEPVCLTYSVRVT